MVENKCDYGYALFVEACYLIRPWNGHKVESTMAKRQLKWF